jgi:hypothetical protein
LNSGPPAPKAGALAGLRYTLDCCCVDILVLEVGFAPTTSRLSVARSGCLSYPRLKLGRGGAIRTHIAELQRLVLYPVKLRPNRVFGAPPRYRAALFGASNRRFHLISLRCMVLSVTNRTDALPLTRRVLCQLSYDSMFHKWWFGQATILGPPGYEPVALPAELPNRKFGAPGRIRTRIGAGRNRVL